MLHLNGAGLTWLRREGVFVGLVLKQCGAAQATLAQVIASLPASQRPAA